MRTLSIVLCIAALWLASPSISVADGSSKTSEELALEILDVTGGAQMAQQIMQMISAQIRPAFPTVPDEIWTELIGSLDSEELSRLVVPIYTKHYSRDELVGLLEFYRSPLGQRLIQATPKVMQESMAVGGAWGQAKANEIIERLKAEGYEPREV